MIHSFDAPLLLMSIPSEISMLFYRNIFVTHGKIDVNNLADNIYQLFQK